MLTNAAVTTTEGSTEAGACVDPNCEGGEKKNKPSLLSYVHVWTSPPGTSSGRRVVESATFQARSVRGDIILASVVLRPLSEFSSRTVMKTIIAL